MKIISLYPYDDVHQVVSEDEETIYYQGSKKDCENRIKKIELNEQMRDNLKAKLFRTSILHRNI